MMRTRYIRQFLWICMLALTAVACTNEDSEQLQPDATKQGVINVHVAPMQIIGEQVPYESRALQPLAPEYENTIYTLTLVLFDSEQLLINFPDGLPYRFHDLRDGNGNGLLNPYLELDLGQEMLERIGDQSVTVCLIANMEEEEIAGKLQELADANDQAIFLNAFKNIEVEIPYSMPGTGNFEQGHVDTIYMFGYYEGKLTHPITGEQLTSIDISLGRIISRLEMAFTIPDGVDLDNKTIYCCMENLERNAHLFPIGISPGAGAWNETGTQPAGKYFGGSMGELSVKDSPRRFTIYFYAGPTSAQNASQALQLQMWYREKGLSPEAMTALYEGGNPDATIHLCNDQPSVSADNRNYYLNRNSVYRFSLNLTYKQ